MTIRPPRDANYERNDDNELIETWLAKRAFIVAREGGNDAKATGEPLGSTRPNTGSHHGSARVASPPR